MINFLQGKHTKLNFKEEDKEDSNANLCPVSQGYKQITEHTQSSKYVDVETLVKPPERFIDPNQWSEPEQKNIRKTKHKSPFSSTFAEYTARTSSYFPEEDHTNHIERLVNTSEIKETNLKENSHNQNLLDGQ